MTVTLGFEYALAQDRGLLFELDVVPEIEALTGSRIDYWDADTSYTDYDISTEKVRNNVGMAVSLYIGF